jgi:hypothetical protein
MAAPTPDNLERLGRLLEAGTLRVPIQNTYSLDRAGEALRALGVEHTQGKRDIQVTRAHYAIRLFDSPEPLLDVGAPVIIIDRLSELWTNSQNSVKRKSNC